MLPPESQLPSNRPGQSIIKTSGLLDRTCAEQIWNRIMEQARGGVGRIVVDLSQAGPVLADGVMALRRGWQAQRTKLNSAVYFTGLNGKAASSFQLHGISISAGRILFDYKPVAQKLHRGALVACPSCHKRLRVRRVGTFACPHCQHHFQCDFKHQLEQARDTLDIDGHAPTS